MTKQAQDVRWASLEGSADGAAMASGSSSSAPAYPSSSKTKRDWTKIDKEAQEVSYACKSTQTWILLKKVAQRNDYSGLSTLIGVVPVRLSPQELDEEKEEGDAALNKLFK